MISLKDLEKNVAHADSPPQNNLNSLKVLKISQEATLPTRAHPDDAGLDLYALEDCHLKSGAGTVVRTGVAIALPTGFVAWVADRSSLAKRGLKTAGGVIDAGYRGEIHIIFWNLSQEPLHLKKGERIAQLLIFPIGTPSVLAVQELETTQRGLKGFGSTGK